MTGFQPQRAGLCGNRRGSRPRRRSSPITADAAAGRRTATPGDRLRACFRRAARPAFSRPWLSSSASASMAPGSAANMPPSSRSKAACRDLFRPRARVSASGTVTISGAHALTQQEIIAVTGIGPKNSLLFLDVANGARAAEGASAGQGREHQQALSRPCCDRCRRAQALRSVAAGRRREDRRRRRHADRQL